MVTKFEPIGEPYAFQASDVTKDKPHSAFQVPQDQWETLKPDLHPIHTRAITQEDIHIANEVVAIRVEEFTKKYARNSSSSIIS